MESTINSLNIILPVLYVIVTIDYALFFFRDDPFAKKTVTPLLTFTATVHFAYLVLLIIAFRHLPLANVFEAISTLSFAAVIVYLYLEYRTKVKSTGLLILFIVFLFQLISSLNVIHSTDIHPLLLSNWFAFHTSCAIIGYSAFAISAVYGFLYLMLYHEIKSKHFGLVYSRLPSLEILTDMNLTVASFGFVFLTTAIILGILWSRSIYTEYWSDPKFIVGILTWVIYGVSIAGKNFASWQGKRIAYLTLLGFVVILFSLIAVNLLFKTFHDFQTASLTYDAIQL